MALPQLLNADIPDGSRWEAYKQDKRREISVAQGLIRLATDLQRKAERLRTLSDREIRLININDGYFYASGGYLLSGQRSCGSDPVYQKIEQTLLGCGHHGYTYPGATVTYAGETHHNILSTLAGWRNSMDYRTLTEKEYQFIDSTSIADIVKSIVNGSIPPPRKP